MLKEICGNFLKLALACFLTVLFAACAHVSVSSKEFLGVPNFPPTNPASVQIMRDFPARPTVVLGDIEAQPSGSPTNEQIENKIRVAAAQMGADAAVVIADRTVLAGASITGGFGNRQISRDYERVIIAKAIRYN